ncbi:toll-like receptor 4 [Mytilus californianus]|uniref:toll-like receptor 4 n=1 Tax=Mytilus californianus TaxID=6549 RepID=UPI0022474B5E|nr:toll-like receptor 4 [Mytilus californianus]
MEFRKLQRLRILQIGYCTLNRADSETFANINYLEYMDLSMCSIEKYKYGFEDMKSLQYLKLGNPTFFNSDVYHMVQDLETSNIEILVMTNLFYKVLKFPNVVFYCLNSTNILELYINYNGLRRVVRDEQFNTFPTTLKILDMSNNMIKEFLFDIPYLIQLVLRNNSLGNFLSVQSYTVSSSLKLRHIDLSQNSIYRLKYSLFNGHDHLESINLSRNFLQELSFDLSKQKDLKVLDLSHNFIRQINQTFISCISKIFVRSNLIINLSNNLLECSCRTYLTMKWMLENINHFLYSETYKCQYDDRRLILLNNFKEIVQQMEKTCSSHLILIVCVSIFVATFCLMIAIGLVYRYRWKLRYIYYMARSKYRQYKPVNSNSTYTYDAFISYADHERDFIINECIPNLEQKWKLKLCIHHRDFLPGEEITVNITNAIHDSRKTICLVTRLFLESYYCMFEFNMARMESIYSRNGENILFLVFYDRILPQELSLVMLELVQNQSYIEYPHDDQGNVVFWEKNRESCYRIVYELLFECFL